MLSLKQTELYRVCSRFSSTGHSVHAVLHSEIFRHEGFGA